MNEMNRDLMNSPCLPPLRQLDAEPLCVSPIPLGGFSSEHIGTDEWKAWILFHLPEKKQYITHRHILRDPDHKLIICKEDVKESYRADSRITMLWSRRHLLETYKVLVALIHHVLWVSLRTELW